MIKSFNNLSFKLKTILGIAIIESILLALIYFTSINSLNETNEKQIQSRADETSNLISLWVADGLLTFDVGNTEAFINSLVSGESISYIHVKNESGNTFAFAGEKIHLNKLIKADVSLESAEDDGIYDVIAPIMVGNHQIGSVEIGLPVFELSKFIDNVAYKIKVIALAEVFLSGIFSFMLGWFLTRRLYKLRDSALSIQRGGNPELLNDNYKDEIGVVSQALSKMATTLVEKEKVLHLNQLKLERVFNSSPVGIVVFMENAQLGSVNPAFKSILDCKMDINGADINYQQFYEIISKRLDKSDFQTQKWSDEFSSFEHLKKSETKHFIQFIEPNYRLLEVSIQLIRDEYSGVHSIMYFDDMTHTQEIERLKSAFLAHAAHELRTPMTSVQGFSELLMAQKVPDSERIELAKIINTQSQRVVEMVSQLLDISTIESGGVHALKREDVNPCELVEKVLNEFSLPTGREAPKTYCDYYVPDINVDPVRMYQVVLNLLSNAYKYSKEEDVVRVSVTPFFDKETSVEAADITIEDAGIGMTEEQLEHIFDRFWRADNSGFIPGTGLGMSLVKDIVDILGGDILIESALGKGTSITIRTYITNHGVKK